jgi:hypothetical protein
MSTYFYKYVDVYPISMNTSKRLGRLNFEIHKVGHQERLTVDTETSFFIEKIIIRKCSIHDLNLGGLVPPLKILSAGLSPLCAWQ